MAAEKGLSFLLKRGDGETSESFTTIGAQRSTSFTINGEAVEITSKDSSGFRILLAGAGVKSMSIAASGIYDDSATELLIETAARDETIDNYELLFESGDKWAGAFQVTDYENAGEHNGEVTYSLTLESSGEFIRTNV